MKLISGSSNRNLASRVAHELNIELLETKINSFGDGELRVQIDGQIDSDIVILQSTNTPVHDHLMELLLLADAAKRARAHNITAIIPYFGYSRQDRCTYKNGPISSSLVIKMIEVSGINRVITLDLHSSQLEGVFNIPVNNLGTEDIFLHLKKDKKNTIIVSPDIGGISRARKYSLLYNTELAIINKSRDLDNICSMNQIIGDVKGKNCLIIDDIIDGASTLCMATDLLIQKGASSVSAIITHAVLSQDAIKRVENSRIEKIHITDSIFHQHLPRKFIIVNSHKLIASAIIRA